MAQFLANMSNVKPCPYKKKNFKTEKQSLNLSGAVYGHSNNTTEKNLYLSLDLCRKCSPP